MGKWEEKKKLWTLKPAYLHILCYGLASQVALQVVKNPPANAEDTGDTGLIPGLGKSS